MSKSSREELVKETEIDPQLQKLKEVIVTGWSACTKNVNQALRYYFRDEL